jgi:cell division protein FtsZ
VTAGLDLQIGEFDEVGNVVKERASDDATVVLGTVIDPSMEGEVRVTVVATGLGGVTRAQAEPRLRVATPTQRAARGTRVNHAGKVNYSELDAPPSGRRFTDEPEEVEAPRRAVGQSFDYRADSEILDIPAFLRRQAD